MAGPGLYPNKRKIETKYKLPQLNWAILPATQITGTVFTQLDDENVLKQINFTEFEETFKLKTQTGEASVDTLVVLEDKNVLLSNRRTVDTKQ